MESVGELLRREREAQGKSIEDVAKVTRMSAQTLAAIEEDRFNALPAPVYVKGHLRTYARFLGLDEEEIIQRYMRSTKQHEPAELDEWDAVELELHEEERHATRRNLWIAAAVVLIGLALIFGPRLWSRRPPSGPTEDREIPVVTEPAREAASRDTMIEWHRLELMAVAKERTWLRVSVDGVPVSDLTLEPGDRRRWEADESFQLDVGNGGALELYLDGEFLGTAGLGRRLVEGLVVTEAGMSQ
jgi:transcriptional regulator with XRE-family HTH domain